MGNLKMIRPPGFTMFEAIVAMFILLMGVLGVVAVFSAGMHSRVRAQELIISQDLANMWADWVRFRLNDDATAGVLVSGGHQITLADLTVGKKGDFYAGTADAPFQVGATGAPGNLPTTGCGAYQGYTWAITGASDYTPKWVPEAGGSDNDWTEKIDGSPIYNTADFGAFPGNLKTVELSIFRGARKYIFRFVFSGVGLKYDTL